MQNREQIVVVGFGWVGQANALALSAMGYPVAYLDPMTPVRHYGAYADSYAGVRRLSSAQEADSADTVYLVCVGDKVAEDGTQDIANIHAALETLRGVEGTVVLRSTILPDLLAGLPFDYYMPEFLHEKTAVEECLSPHFVVVGSDNPRKKEPSFIALWRRRTPQHFDGTPREAAFVKYLSNLWNATRIAFVNEYGDAITTPNSPRAVDSISRVINFVLGGEGYTRYGRAFGGHCLPKDMRAFIKHYGDGGRHVELLRGAYASNDAHREMERDFPSLPEWFSAWQTPHMSGLVAWRELWYSIVKNFLDPRDFLLRYWRQIWIAAGVLLLTDLLLLVIL